MRIFITKLLEPETVRALELKIRDFGEWDNDRMPHENITAWLESMVDNEIDDAEEFADSGEDVYEADGRCSYCGSPRGEEHWPTCARDGIANDVAEEQEQFQQQMDVMDAEMGEVAPTDSYFVAPRKESK